MKRRHGGWLVVGWVAGLGTGCVGGSKEIGATVAESDSDSDSDSSSDSDAEAGLDWSGTGTCEVVAGDHAASCPTLETCPIMVDVEIVCDGEGLAGGVRTIAESDQTTVTVGGTPNNWLFEVVSNEQVTALELPADWASNMVAKADDLLVFAQAFRNDDRAGVYALVRDGGVWTEELVYVQPGTTPRYIELVDFGFADGVPQLWFQSEPVDSLYSRAVRSGVDEWTENPVTTLDEPSDDTRFRSVDGKTMVFDLDLGGPSGHTIVTMLDGGTPSYWESPSFGGYWYDYDIASDVALGAADLPMPAALSDEVAVGFTWGPGPDLPSFMVPDLPMLTNPCDQILEDCNETCEVDDFGTGENFGSYRVARTADGVAWLVATVTHLKESWTYVMGDEEYCNGRGMDEGSTGEVVVYRVDGTNAEPVRVFSLPTEAPVARYGGGDLSVSTVGDELAIAISLHVGERRDSGTKLRVLRLDTTRLVAE